jgi:phosphate:Na+ symporter
MLQRVNRRALVAAWICAAAMLAVPSPLCGHVDRSSSLEPDTTASAGAIRLVKPDAATGRLGSGDDQYRAAGAVLEHPLRVRVETSTGVPVAGRTVRFTVAGPAGSEGASLTHETVRTDQDGYAETRLRLGSAVGVYLVTASSGDGRGGAQTVVFRATARDPHWVFALIAGLVGGLGIFLFGLRMMSDGLKKTAARRIRSVLSTLTYNRFIAVGAGAIVTVIVQSSSATTVMLVSLVNAGLMTFAQSVGMILGADIGTTVTAQLIAFRLTDYSLLLIGVGIALTLASKKDKVRDVGESIMGFGLLFFGMHIMSQSMGALKTYEGIVGLLVSLENPALAILVGTVFTGLIQSSAAFIGILIILAAQGLLSLEAAIPLLFGANIGTCVTALLAGIGTNREAQRVALTHVLFKIAGVALFIGWIPRYAELIRWISPSGDPSLTGAAHVVDVLPRQIANAHTVFNVALTLMMLPFTRTAVRLVQRLVPAKPEREEPPYHTRHINKALLSTPTLALNLAKSEVLHMGEIVESMVENVIRPFVERDRRVVQQLERDETKVDYLQDQIQKYLAGISRQSVAEERITEVFQMMYTVTELEQIGDIIAKSLLPRAREWLDRDLEFSPAGRAELVDYHLRAVKQVSRALAVFQDVNLEAASRMKEKHKKYRAMEEQYLRAHFERIRRDVPETLVTSEHHQELMEQFRRINSHATRIARILLSWKDEPATSRGGEQNPPRS